MTNEDTRAVPRFEWRCPVTFRVLGSHGRPPDKDAVSCNILDLSDHGLRVHMEKRRLEKGTIVLVKLPLSLAPVVVPFLAQVKWIREVQPAAYELGPSM